jgi:hypothetical protein
METTLFLFVDVPGKFAMTSLWFKKRRATHRLFCKRSKGIQSGFTLIPERDSCADAFAVFLQQARVRFFAGHFLSCAAMRCSQTWMSPSRHQPVSSVPLTLPLLYPDGRLRRAHLVFFVWRQVRMRGLSSQYVDSDRGHRTMK